MKKLRQLFEDNYTAVPIPANNKKGFKMKYVYYKPWYVLDLPAAAVKKKKVTAAVSLAVSVLLFIAAGSVYTGVNVSAYVAAPAALSFCALIFVFLGVVQFCFIKQKTTEQNFNDVRLKLLTCTLVHAGLLFLAVLACIYTMITTEISAAGVSVSAAFLVSALLSVFIRKQYRSIPVRTEKNDALEKYDIGGSHDRG